MKKIENLKLLLTKNSIQDQERSLNKDDSPLFQRGVWGGLKKLAMTTIAVFAIGLLANFLVETKDTNAGRQPGDFLNQDFWDNYSSNGNLIAALYGDGTPGSSPYNRFWTGGCNISGVVYVNPGHNTIPTIENNKIYVLNSGNYTMNSQKTMDSCSAIVGKGKVKITAGLSIAIFANSKQNMIIDNLKIEGNTGHNGIFLNNASQNTINNVEVWGTLQGIKLENSNHNTLNKIVSHDNSNYGIWLSNGDNNYINNSQFYHNYNGVFFSSSEKNTLNNIQVYNNRGPGIQLSTSSEKNTLNNIQSYNNKDHGLSIDVYSKENTLNNIQVYNNNNGLKFSSNSSNNILNNIETYNNRDRGISVSHGGNNEYYGSIKSFDNNNGDIYTTGVGSSLTEGVGSNLRADGELITGGEMSRDYITNPVNSIGQKLLDGTDWTAMRGKITGFTASEPTKYIFGKEILKQVQPVRYNDLGELELFGIQGLDRDPSEFIAAVNMELSPTDQAIVDYYYGPNSEFTVNWNENNCSLGAFTVEYVNNSAELLNKLVNNSPLGHTIYVLADNTFDMGSTTQIDIQDNCVAIANQGSGATIKRTSNNLAPIKISGKENIILDGINIDGGSNSQYGIILEKIGSESSNNNTLNNIKSYKNTKNGIMLGASASYNTIMNTQTWNNGEHGIEIYLGGQYNIINNSLSYNNSKYGIRFGNISKYNTINNSQFFNNNEGGIFADFTTEQNIINNVHTYNNAGYGINFKRSSGNSLHNVYSYHNNVGINMTDISCVNNQFNGELLVAGNTLDNLVGTDGHDTYLIPAGANSSLVRLPGTLETGDNSMSCDLATNPRNIYMTTTWLLDVGSGCANTGIQTAWNPANPNSIDYMFGLSISKQRNPVGYAGGIISLLDNQFDPIAYIGEKNPIIWTDPGTIYLLSGNETDLALNINHEINVIYNTGMINHDFDVALTLYPSSTNGHIQIKTAGTWNNIGTGMTGLDFSTLEGVRIIVTTPNENYKNISGTLYVGTNQYGHDTGYFNIRTVADQTPPTITWNDNISSAGLWEGESDTWQATISGIYATSGRASYVTGASQCHSGIAIPTNTYNNTILDISLHPDYNTFNNKYICILAKDNVNNHYKTGLSNKIKISKLEFVNDIDAGPVYYDIIDINSQNLQNYGYKRVNTTGECNTGLYMADMIDYTGPIVISNDISLNGKYICAYGEDGTGSGRYLASSNNLDIIDYSSTVNFIDDVSPNWVSSERIEAYFLSTITFSHKKYKWVDNMTDCNNNIDMVDYTGAINIDHQGLNNKHFCLYSKEDVSGIENYLISTNKVRVDITNPTTPTIISPTSGQNIYWLVIETLGANDADSGLAGFEYEIAENQTFLDVIASGIIYTTNNEFSPMFDEDQANYAIRVKSVDNVSNKSARGNIINFNYKNLANFDFQNINNAQLGTAYVSNEITMGGLGANEVIKASVTDGVLLRNGNPLGTSGFVQNDDKLSIEIISSNSYSGVVETELKIANRIVPWKITTTQSGTIINTGIVSGCNLNHTEMISVQAIFDSIVNMYTNPAQLHSFLLVMQSMLQDNIALAGGNNVDNLECLSYLIQEYIDENFNNQDSNIHKTPNCKEYLIVHSSGDNTYYSPNTVKQIKFGSRDELVKFLDSHNPGDCHINTYGNTVSYNNTDPNRHFAPNGKVYQIDSSNIGFSSPDFVNVKYFATIGELRAFIDKNNPAIVVWSHNVDTEFTPIIHTAPNEKTYKIYKTNRGYMSYKLIKVQYFDTLEELQSYIDKNNK